MYELDDEWSKRDDYKTDAMYRSFNITDEIKACETEISTAEREMNETQQALDKADREMKRIHQALDTEAHDGGGKSKVDGLRFEHEKRQRSIQALQTKIARLSREYQDMLDLHDKVMNGDNPSTDALTRAFSIQDQITRDERTIATAEREMKEIQQALDKEER